MRHKGLSREKQKLVELNEIKTTYYKRIKNVLKTNIAYLRM